MRIFGTQDKREKTVGLYSVVSGALQCTGLLGEGLYGFGTE